MGIRIEAPWESKSDRKKKKHIIIDIHSEETDKGECFAVAKVKLTVNQEVWPRMKSWTLAWFISFGLQDPLVYSSPSVKTIVIQQNN